MDPIIINYKGKSYTLTERRLTLGDMADSVRMVSVFEVKSEDPAEVLENLNNTEFYDRLLKLALDGDRPDVPAFKWMPLDQGLEVMDNFFDSNADALKKLDSSFARVVGLIGGTLSQNSTDASQSLTEGKPKPASSMS